METPKYPVRIERDAAGRYLATCRDVPEALTDGETVQEARVEMADALMVALEGYRQAGQATPAASRPEPGEIMITVKEGVPLLGVPVDPHPQPCLRSVHAG